MKRLLIWDLPTRLFHWALALSFAGAWLTSESDRWLAVHVFLGYLMLGLVGFRLLWGVVGSPYARFRSFWYGPRAAPTHRRQLLRGQAARHVGHNPAGSLAIYGLLLLTLLIGVTGILTLGGEEQHGLAAGWLSPAQGQQIKALHEAAAIVMLLLVLGHSAGLRVERYLAPRKPGARHAHRPQTGRGSHPHHPAAARGRGRRAGTETGSCGRVVLSQRQKPDAQSGLHRPPTGRQRPLARRMRQLPPGVSPVAAASALMDATHDGASATLRLRSGA